jgi:hypothetical protein
MQHQPVNMPLSSNTRTASSEWVLEIKSLDQVNLVRLPEKAKTTLLRQDQIGPESRDRNLLLANQVWSLIE